MNDSFYFFARKCSLGVFIELQSPEFPRANSSKNSRKSDQKGRISLDFCFIAGFSLESSWNATHKKDLNEERERFVRCKKKPVVNKELSNEVKFMFLFGTVSFSPKTKLKSLFVQTEENRLNVVMNSRRQEKMCVQQRECCTCSTY